MDKINLILKKEFNLRDIQIENTVKLIDEGNTIPFIARYRKEVTGNLDDQVLRELNERLTYLRNLESRKEEVIKSITEQEKMTDELMNKIVSANILQEVEDLYRPYKPKRRTRATIAKEKGLENLALLMLKQEINEGDPSKYFKEYINEDLEVETLDDAQNGANDIIAEIISDNADFRKKIREISYENGVVITRKVKQVDSVYEMYYEYSESVKSIANHRVLAINRGEKEKFIKVEIEIDEKLVLNYLFASVIKDESIFRPYIIEAIEDAYKRLIKPSIERELRSSLTEKAEEDAMKVFAKNLKSLLLQPPVKDKVVLGLDPAYRTGCKIAVVDDIGKVLSTGVIYPTPPVSKVEQANKTVLSLIKKYKINIISIGNGTASKEAEIFVANLIKDNNLDVKYMVVSESGASVYSASKLAAKEFPEFDVSLRSAVSIARRLQDPLAELVKIDPKAIGVGQYQHDMNQKKLDESLGNVVEDCVNSVGVDLNTASSSLLKYISGVTPKMSENIVKFREKNGKFSNRQQLMEVKMLGEKSFEQCAGFLRLSDGENPLDNTSVHPESYDTTNTILELFDYSKEDISHNNIEDIEKKVIDMFPYKDTSAVSANEMHGKTLHNLSDLKKLKFVNKKKATFKDKFEFSMKELSKKYSIGLFTLNDIISEIKKPGRDPRESLPEIQLRTDVLDFKDVEKGMEFTGTVRNVVDFGAFIDIGVHQDGLVHISEISNKYIKHPMEVLSVGDIVKVKVKDVDKEKKRLSLTMKLK